MSKGPLANNATPLVNASPKIAIVIPVCDVAPYLEDCLDSVLKQTYSKFHVFAVDDKSSDSSPSILKRYLEADSRVSVSFLDQRKGVSNARNVALDQIDKLANFDYVAFVDSDDILSPYFLEMLVKKSLEAASDISVCGFFNFCDGKEAAEKLVAPTEKELSQEEFIEHIFARGRWNKKMGGGGMVWKALYSSNAVRGCRFPCDVKIVEDEVFSVKAAINSRKFAYVPLPLYGHRTRSGSLTCDKTIALERLRARMVAFEAGKKLSEEARLVIASAVADASIKAFEYSGKFFEIQLRSYKSLVLQAAAKGLIRKKKVGKFLLFCDYPTISKIFVTSQNLVAKLKNYVSGKKGTLVSLFTEKRGDKDQVGKQNTPPPMKSTLIFIVMPPVVFLN